MVIPSIGQLTSIGLWAWIWMRNDLPRENVKAHDLLIGRIVASVIQIKESQEQYEQFSLERRSVTMGFLTIFFKSMYTSSNVSGLN